MNAAMAKAPFACAADGRRVSFLRMADDPFAYVDKWFFSCLKASSEVASHRTYKWL
jgi:hypothetical protein